MRFNARVASRGALRSLLVFSTALTLALAQQPQQPIRVQVNEVIVPVTVTDDKGRFVSNLEQKDFQILDQGRDQKIEFFEGV